MTGPQLTRATAEYVCFMNATEFPLLGRRGRLCLPNFVCSENGRLADKRIGAPNDARPFINLYESLNVCSDMPVRHFCEMAVTKCCATVGVVLAGPAGRTSQSMCCRITCIPKACVAGPLISDESISATTAQQPHSRVALSPDSE